VDYTSNVATGDNVTVSAILNQTGTVGFNKSGGGTIRFNANNAFTGATTVTDGKIQLGASQTNSPAYSLSGTGVIEIASGGSNSRVLKTTTLSLAGSSKVDLKDNKLIVSGAAANSTWTGSAYGGVAGLVQKGFNGGAWNGAAAIVTSESNAAPATHVTSLGIASADALGRVGQTFAGQTLASGDMLVMYTYGGDANLDGKIDGDDYFRIDANAGLVGGSVSWLKGDFNYDGRVNGDDYFIIDANVGRQTLGTFPLGAAVMSSDGDASAGIAAVPEPASAAFAAASVSGVLALRRSRLRRRR